MYNIIRQHILNLTLVVMPFAKNNASLRTIRVSSLILDRSFLPMNIAYSVRRVLCFSNRTGPIGCIFIAFN